MLSGFRADAFAYCIWTVCLIDMYHRCILCRISVGRENISEDRLVRPCSVGS